MTICLQEEELFHGCCFQQSNCKSGGGAELQSNLVADVNVVKHFFNAVSIFYATR